MRPRKPDWWDQPNHPVFIVVLVVLLAFTAWLAWSWFIDSDDSDQSSRSSPSAPSTAQSPNAAAPTETLPVLPDAAKQKTLAGVKSFVEYYFDVLNYTQSTNDVTPLRQIQQEEQCSACQNQLKIFEDIERDNQRIVGGEYQVQAIAATPVDNDTYTCTADFVSEDSSLLGASGETLETISSREASGQILQRVTWIDDSWQIVAQRDRRIEGD